MTGKFECYFEEKLPNFTTEEPITAFFAIFHEKWLNSQENGLNRICNIIIERVYINNAIYVILLLNKIQN